MSTRRTLACISALSAIVVVAACGAEPPEPAVPSEVCEEPPPAEADEAPCAHGVWSGSAVLHFDYLACRADADCLVVQWGDECQNASTYGQHHAHCVALSPVCPLDEASESPHEARCNTDGLCELVLF